MGKDSDHVEEPIELVPHDPEWVTRFEGEKAALERTLGITALEVHHIGSTAVSGLAAKPVIDILVAVESLDDRGPLGQALSGLGYVNVSHDDDDKRLFFRKGAPRAYHVHVVKLNSWTYWRHLLFRDILRSSPAARVDYERLKQELAMRFRDDRDAYTDAKGEFIERLVVQSIRK